MTAVRAFVAAVLLLCSVVPAHAGQYECIDAESSLTLNGVTTEDTQPSFGAEYASGGNSVSYSFSGTYKFIWVADPEVECEDDPVAEERNLGYTGTLRWYGNPGSTISRQGAVLNGH